MPVTKAELKKLKYDRDYSFEVLLKVIDRETTRLKPFKLNVAQRKLDAFLDANPWSFVLKSRQLGCSTYVLARFFHKALFNPNFNVAIVAHTKEAVVAIFNIIHRFYDNLPPDLKEMAPKIKGSVHELRLSHGGGLVVGTAGSESLRGQTYNAALFSEFAFYANATKAMAAILQTCTPDAEVVIETTANGLNHAHKMWYDSNSGFGKIFLDWRNDPLARMKKQPAYVDPQVWVYAEDHQLDDQQAFWVAHHLSTRCAGDWKMFNQEQPILASLAFVGSGARVFQHSFPHVLPQPGYHIYRQPEPMHTYVCGIDTATGKPDGDFSSFVMTDVTDAKDIHIAAVFYKRVAISEFSVVAITECRRYNEALAVIETNGPGPATVEAFIGAEYGNLYRRPSPLKIGEDDPTRIGWYTSAETRPIMMSRLRSYVDSGKLELIDPNLQHEANSFIYNSSGREEADSGCHDDGLLAASMSLMGIDQTQHMAGKRYLKKPQGIKEILEWESATGELYESTNQNFNDNFGGSDYGMTTLDDLYSMR